MASVAADERQLEEFGYKQELPRVLRLWTNWAIGFALNAVAALWLTFELVNIAWPRYGDLPWWQNWAFLLGMGAFGIAGLAYFLVRRPDRAFALGGAAVPVAEPAPTPGADDFDPALPPADDRQPA
jgi:hypothetical protein